MKELLNKKWRIKNKNKISFKKMFTESRNNNLHFKILTIAQLLKKIIINFKKINRNLICNNLLMKSHSRASNNQSKNNILNRTQMNTVKFKTRSILCRKHFNSMKIRGRVWTQFYKKD